MKGFEFDRDNFSFKKSKLHIFPYVRALLFIVIGSLSLTIVAYFLISIFFSTGTEKKLAAVNREYAREFSKFKAEDDLLCESITMLQAKDAVIYSDVFRSAAPNVDPVGKLDFLFASDTLPDTRLHYYTYCKSLELQCRAEKVDSVWVKIAALLSDPDFKLPPMSLPIEGINYVAVGAGEGTKVNPFYQSEVYHSGLDFIAPRGCPVLATAGGTVTEAVSAIRGQGKYVTIDHGNGYRTRYAHLSEMTVFTGQHVRRGQMIARVGMSGQAFAPHLHYEVIRDTVAMNPINYIFASVEPGEYANMLFMAANTKQSMD